MKISSKNFVCIDTGQDEEIDEEIEQNFVSIPTSKRRINWEIMSTELQTSSV